MEISETILIRWVSMLSGTNYKPASKVYNHLRTLLKMHGTGRPPKPAPDAKTAKVSDDCKGCMYLGDSGPTLCHICSRSFPKNHDDYQDFYKVSKNTEKNTATAPDFIAIAREIEEKAYGSGTFFPALCAQILRKHFGKEE